MSDHVTDEQHLMQTREALALLEHTLMDLKRDFDAGRLSPSWYAVMAEPIVDHIRDLRRQIEDQVGFTFAVAKLAEPEIARSLEEADAGSPPELPSGMSPDPTQAAR